MDHHLIPKKCKYTNRAEQAKLSGYLYPILMNGHFLSPCNQKVDFGGTITTYQIDRFTFRLKQTMYHYMDGGLRNVWLANGYEIKQTPYGEGIAIHNLDGLIEAICLALTEKAGVLTGVEFRHLRSAGMLLSQPALGKLMGIDGQSIARWKKTGRVPHAGRTS